MFCLFLMTSCSVKDDDGFEIDPGDTDTGQTGSEDETQNHDTDTTDADTTDPDGSDTDNADTDDSGTDTDSNDTGISDNDTSDSDDNDPDNSDDNDPEGSSDDDTDTDQTGPDGDTQDPDNDTTEIDDNDSDDTDDSDTEGSSDDDTDTDSGESGEIPECSSTSTTPCKAGNLIWSSRSTATKDWENAKSDCSHWSEGTLTSGWRLPTINELRRVMRNCSKTESGGNCRVTDECAFMGTDIEGNTCYSNSSCKKVLGDICATNLEHSPFGETDKLWSALKTQDDPDWAWYVSFYNGEIAWAPTGDKIYYRCVHSID